jgi:broad specificity phosphatase PhoE
MLFKIFYNIMKLFLLRHEERPEENDFYTELTEKGKENSLKKIQELEKLNIDKIFCSPFIRCIQTIEPYCLKNGKSVNIECSLGEYPYNEMKERMSHPVEFIELFNMDYVPVLSRIPLYENLKDLKERVKEFCSKLLMKYYDRNINILIVSHQSVINTIEHLVTNSKKDLEIHSNFPMGCISKNVLKK